MNTTPNPDPTAPTPGGPEPPGQTPNPQRVDTPGKTSIDSLPADIQEYIKELRQEASQANKQTRALIAEKEARSQAEQQAEQARLKEQGEFKALAEKHEARVKEIEPVIERYTALSSVIAEQIKQQTRDWPKEVKDLLASDDIAIDVRYAQVQKLQQLVDKMLSQQRGIPPGNSPGPKPAGQLTEEEQQKRAYDRQRATGHYPRF